VTRQRYISLLAGAFFLILISALFANSRKGSGLFEPFYFYQFPDSNDKKQPAELPYPIDDRQGDHVTDQNDNPFTLNDTTQKPSRKKWSMTLKRACILLLKKWTAEM
jgi:hypothetical protein